MSRGDKAAVARTLTAIGRRADIRYARVSDSALRSVAEFGSGVIVSRRAGPIDAAPELNPLTTIYLGTYPVTADIISGGKSLGRLVLIADLSGLRTGLIDSLVSSLIAGAFVALIGIAAAFRFQRRLTAPIQRLTAAMQDVRDKRDYERAVPHANNDEIGQMVDAFNAMLTEIRDRDRDLMAHRDRLELEVVERTAEYLEAKDSAEAANAAKSDFLATMSHEIRTPMNGMLVMAELMSVSGLTPRLQRYADVLVKSGQSLLAIINDILDVSKIESGKLSLEVIEVDPRAIIDDVLKLFSERAATKGLDLAGYVSPNVPRRIAADPVRLNQILSNLVNNALKFTDQGGIFVELVTRRDTRGGPARTRSQRQRFRDRTGQGQDRYDLRGLLPGRPIDDAALWRHRHRPHHLPPPCRGHGRCDHCEVRTGSRLRIYHRHTADGDRGRGNEPSVLASRCRSPDRPCRWTIAPRVEMRRERLRI